MSGTYVTLASNARVFGAWVLDGTHRGGPAPRASQRLAARAPVPLVQIRAPAVGQNCVVKYRLVEDSVDTYWEARVLAVVANSSQALVRFQHNSDDELVSVNRLYESPSAGAVEARWPSTRARNPEW